MHIKSFLSSTLFALLLAFLVLPHSASASIGSTYTTKIGPNAGEYGSAVSLADVNNDGYADTIVGSYSYSSSKGRVFIYYGSASGSSITPDITIDGPANGSQFGYTLTSADVNNDTYADVIVGAYGYSTFAGRTYVYYGGASMDTTADVTLSGENANDLFGSALAVGDVNNDTYPDVIVGAYGYSTSAGRVYVYYGGASMDTTADVTMTGSAASNFGITLSSSDVNGDGYDDVIAGANKYSSFTGRTYVYYGGASMDTTADVTMTGENVSDRFGVSVATSDVNNDGYSDVVVGASLYSSSTGRAYLYYGGASMDSTVDVVFDGENANDHFGFTVAAIGDVNGDGYGDIVVDAEAYPSSSYTGRVYMYYGGASMDNTADVTIDAENSGDEFGGYTTPFGSGDINGDSAPDLVIGAPGADNGNYDGAVYIYINDAAEFALDGTGGGGHDQGSEPEGPRYTETFDHVSDILQPTQVTTPNRPIQIKVKITRRDLTHITLLIGRKYYTLYDDGKHGDAKKGDHIFASNPVTFTHSMAYTIKSTYGDTTVRTKGKVTVKK